MELVAKRSVALRGELGLPHLPELRREPEADGFRGQLLDGSPPSGRSSVSLMQLLQQMWRCSALLGICRSAHFHVRAPSITQCLDLVSQHLDLYLQGGTEPNQLLGGAESLVEPSLSSGFLDRCKVRHPLS